jgi:hypothetical protein
LSSARGRTQMMPRNSEPGSVMRESTRSRYSDVVVERDC